MELLNNNMGKVNECQVAAGEDPNTGGVPEERHRQGHYDFILPKVLVFCPPLSFGKLQANWRTQHRPGRVKRDFQLPP